MYIITNVRRIFLSIKVRQCFFFGEKEKENKTKKIVMINKEKKEEEEEEVHFLYCLSFQNESKSYK
jgi:hypothetical protein